MTDQEKLAKLEKFLARVNGYGYVELSYDKIKGEYLYFHRKSGELLAELFPERFERRSVLDAVLNDNF